MTNGRSNKTVRACDRLHSISLSKNPNRSQVETVEITALFFFAVSLMTYLHVSTTAETLGVSCVVFWKVKI